MTAEHRAPNLYSPRYWPTWFGFLLLRAVLLLPYRAVIVVGRFLGRLMMPIAGERRRIAQRNLEVAFPELDAAQRHKLLKAHFASIGASLLEVPLGWWKSDDSLRPLAHLHGIENLHNAKAEGRGVILLSAHFTSLELTGRLLSLSEMCHVMYRPHGNPVVEKIMGGARTRLYNKAIQRNDVRGMIRSLKQGHAVWYAPDQNSGRKTSVFVEFFGEIASTSNGTARIAALTGARVVPFYGVRRDDGTGYDLFIEPALEDYPTGDLQADTLAINRLIERWVRKYPAQYLWIHRRFRTRPNRSDPPFYN